MAVLFVTLIGIVLCTVVCGEDDDGVVRLSAGFQSAQDFTAGSIGLDDEVAICARLAAAIECIIGNDGRVR